MADEARARNFAFNKRGLAVEPMPKLSARRTLKTFQSLAMARHIKFAPFVKANSGNFSTMVGAQMIERFEGVTTSNTAYRKSSHLGKKIRINTRARRGLLPSSLDRFNCFLSEMTG